MDPHSANHAAYANQPMDYGNWDPRYRVSAPPLPDTQYAFTRDFGTGTGIPEMQPPAILTADTTIQTSYVPSFNPSYSEQISRAPVPPTTYTPATRIQIELQQGQLPSQPEFEKILNDYILSLSHKKRDKALIPQKRYESILSILQDPKCTTIESAQFRFWAKKMFKLGMADDGTPIVLHENKKVAVREALYRVLIRAHIWANHGGRDKTSTQVRRHWSWVPKELIARFVRSCPSCKLRRSSHLSADSTRVSPTRTVPNSPSQPQRTPYDSTSYAPPTPPNTAPSSVNRTPVTPPATSQHLIPHQMPSAPEVCMASMREEPRTHYSLAQVAPAPGGLIPRVKQEPGTTQYHAAPIQVTGPRTASSILPHMSHSSAVLTQYDCGFQQSMQTSGAMQAPLYHGY